jgi:hypothetical protein
MCQELFLRFFDSNLLFLSIIWHHFNNVFDFQVPLMKLGIKFPFQKVNPLI